MRYNVLVSPDNVLTMVDCNEGVITPLFDLGVRISHHDLSFQEATDTVLNLVTHDYRPYPLFLDMLLGTIEREPSTSWTVSKSKYSLTKWDNPKDQRTVY